MAAEPVVPDFAKMQKDLEEKELEAPGGVATPQQYSQLLALYLLNNEMCQAKFLWKRIPQTVKTTTPELTNIWNIGQKLWLRDFQGIYEGLKKEFPAEISPIMTALTEATRKRANNLVAQAYSSINSEDLGVFLGMTADEAVQAVQAEGWEVDSQFIKPKKPVPPEDPVLISDQQMAVLTDYVSFLEG